MREKERYFSDKSPRRWLRAVATVNRAAAPSATSCPRHRSAPQPAAAAPPLRKIVGGWPERKRGRGQLSAATAANSRRRTSLNEAA